MILLEIKWDELFASAIVNIMSGLIVSFVFLFTLLKCFRPKFIISNLICQSIENRDGKEMPKYSFKLVNKSIYHAFDAKVELFLMQPLQHIGASQNLLLKSLPIRTSNANHIKRYRKKYHQKDPFALFAILVHTNEDIGKMLKEKNSYIELKITVRHGLTGLADTFTQHFGDINVIKQNEKFNFGKDIETMPVNKTI